MNGILKNIFYLIIVVSQSMIEHLSLINFFSSKKKAVQFRDINEQRFATQHLRSCFVDVWSDIMIFVNWSRSSIIRDKTVFKSILISSSKYFFSRVSIFQSFRCRIHSSWNCVNLFLIKRDLQLQTLFMMFLIFKLKIFVFRNIFRRFWRSRSCEFFRTFIFFLIDNFLRRYFSRNCANSWK